MFANRPVPQGNSDLIKIVNAFDHFHAHLHVIAVTLAAPDTLLMVSLCVDGQAFNQKARLVSVGKGKRITAQYFTHTGRNTARHIDMNNMGQFVRD